MALGPMDGPFSNDHLDTLVTVLDLLRTGAARTRPELGRISGLGRAVVTQRIGELLESGLVVDGALAPSTGGRAPRELRFRADAGHVLVAALGATSVGVGVADLAGGLLTHRVEPGDISLGPETVLAHVEDLFDQLLAGRPDDAPPVWGVGIGVPGPVEFSTGRTVSPPIMPGWDGYPVRGRLSARYGAPTWVDNDVNLMALGELYGGLARGERDVVYVKVGSGIGAGLISAGRLHRGAQGSAGDVGHVEVIEDSSVVCRCGNTGCLEAVAGGVALARQATAAAADGSSRFLAERAQHGRGLNAEDVAEAAQHGDPLAVEMLSRAGRRIGGTLATVVNLYNPSLIVVGGGVVNAGDLFFAAIRNATFSRSLPLATRDLRIVRSPDGDEAGLRGAAFVVLDELFSRNLLPRWIHAGSPAGQPWLPAVAA
ncbi:ROK family protein [Trujillonella humicola]|uniref:ROK family protein n=1 Tax=Trujillonella humicola TaxID=3383699 RepID=UPI003906BFF3